MSAAHFRREQRPSVEREPIRFPARPWEIESVNDQLRAERGLPPVVLAPTEAVAS